MPQSLSAVYIHLVFSTKGRRALIRDDELRARLHEYLGGISKRLECAPIRVGGIDDHVHILARLNRSTTQADWVRELKRASGIWLGEQGLSDFHWQGGYACFSVSESNLEQVAAYISNQEEHHRRMSFEDELRALLTKHRLEFDERYVWD